MKSKWLTGAMLATLVVVTSAAAQDCGCGNTGSNYTTTASGRCPHAWTYEDASALWDGYCQEQPHVHNWCGLFGCKGGCGAGCGTGCGSRWPTNCDCGTGCGSCGINLGGCGLAGGGCGCRVKGALSGLVHRDCGTSGNFGWSSCGCDDGCDSCGARHGFCLGGGLRARLGSCDRGCDSGCDSGAGCGVN